MTRRTITVAYLTVLAIAVAMAVRAIDWRTVQSLRLAWVWIVTATLVGLVHRAWGVVTWSSVLRLLGATTLGPWSVRARIWATAWMGRYVPGKVAWIAGKVYFGNQLGLSSPVLLLGAFVEVTQQLSLTVVLSAAILAAHGLLGETVATPGLTSILFVVGVAATMHPGPYRLLLRVISALRGVGNGPAPTLGVHLLVRAAGFQVVGIGLSGLGYVLLTKSLVPALSVGETGVVFASFTFAGAIGMLAVFAPSGIGVREGVLTALLTTLVPLETALALAVLGRLWSTAIDVAFYAMTHLAVAVTSAADADQRTR